MEGRSTGIGLIGGVLIAVFAVVTLFSSFAIVDPGERGVVVRLGKVTERVLDEGFTFKKPFIEKVVEMNVKTQLMEANAASASKDLQDVNISVKMNYRLDALKVNKIYQQVRQDYPSVWVGPVLIESIKAASAQFTAEELITKRTEAREEMSELVKTKLNERGIILEAFNITNIGFSSSFTRAIEAKVTAEQDALAAQNKLEQVKFEKQQRIEQAQGEAEAIKIQAQSISSQGGKEYVNLKAIEKWDGKMPTMMMGGDAMPLINIGK